MEEEWRDIAGYEGLYMVSNLGRVKSLNYNRTGQEGILKAFKDSAGYLQVNLFKDGSKKFYLIHRLVAIAFITNIDNLSEVNHIDENKENNCANNLEWCNREYNINYGARNKKASESNKNNQKVSKPIMAIHKINGLILTFSSASEASRQVGIPVSNISACCNGRLKSAGKYIWRYTEQS